MNLHNDNYKQEMGRYNREQPLCFCEYMDQDGSRNHMCLFCCNCDSADKAFDRLMIYPP